jgi:hypothetical protein
MSHSLAHEDACSRVICPVARLDSFSSTSERGGCGMLLTTDFIK